MPATLLSRDDSPLYLPLRSKQFRLLHLQPGPQNAKVQCRLLIGPLKRGQQYEALSYVWGPAHPVQEVIVNGHTVHVTENLYNAVRRLRLLKLVRVLWVDALCINQADPLEKSVQVDLMARIYSAATNVIVWLGDSAPEEDAAVIKAFRRLCHPTRPLHAREGKMLVDTSSQECYERLLASSWFERSWTVQEAILAKRMVVMLGPASVDFETVRESEMDLYLALDVQRRVRVMLGRYGEIAKMRQRRRFPDGKGLTLVQAIYQHWIREATDPRDKAFALLGIVNDWQGWRPIAPDYTLSVEEVYAKMTFEILRRQRCVDFLSTAGLDAVSQEERGDISWVPPFTASTLRWAARHRNSRLSSDIRLHGRTILSLNARRLGTVTAVDVESTIRLNAFQTLFDRLLLESSPQTLTKPELTQILFSQHRQWQEQGHEQEQATAHARTALDGDHDTDDELWNALIQLVQGWTRSSRTLAQDRQFARRLDRLLRKAGGQGRMYHQVNEMGLTDVPSSFAYSRDTGSSHSRRSTGLEDWADDGEPVVKMQQRYRFTVGEGEGSVVGIAAEMHVHDEVWSLDDEGLPFLLRPAGKRLVRTGSEKEEEEEVQTYRLVSRCIKYSPPLAQETYQCGTWKSRTDLSRQRLYLR